MSVRIYQLSKELEMTNKEVIALLKDRGLDVSSPSNTIPNIYADAIKEEFVKKKAKDSPENLEEEKTETTKSTAKKVPPPKEEPATKPLEEKSAPKINLPKGSIVKTASQVEEAKRQQVKKPSPLPPTTPVVKYMHPTSKSPAGAPSTSGTTSAPVAQKEINKTFSTPPSLKKEKQAPPLPTATTSTSAKSPKMPFLPTQPPHINGYKKDKESTTSTEKQENQPLKALQCKTPIIVRDFAALLRIKPFQLISELMGMGLFASMNQIIEEAHAAEVAKKHGFLLEVHHRGKQQEEEVKKKAPPVDESKLLEPRPPIVCVLGHVDHGKTTLLDTIRKTSVVKGEAGGITQHIGAYQVQHNKHNITFIDTPGHAAFSKMRQRGADLTDIAILVVAADDGFMPQTKEALKFAQKANVPIVVAINKMDARGANIDRVKQQMQENGITSEDWGGEVLCTPISAVKGDNIDQLLELILLQAEILELKANPKTSAEGTVVESQIELGKGPTTTVIVQKGTLKVGDALHCGSYYCKVRAMIDDKGNRIKQALPSTPVRLLGWSGAPEAGSSFKVVKNEKIAKQEAQEYKIEQRRDESQAMREKNPQDIAALFAAIESTRQTQFKVILKADVHGSLEALSACLQAIKSDKIKLEIIRQEVGLISPTDVDNAHTADAFIVGFNTKLEPGAQAKAKQLNVQVITHPIIYELIETVKDAMAEKLEPELKENKFGAAQVRQIFPISKGFAAGCMVTEGKVARESFARVLRGKKQEIVYEGKISLLKRFKEDVNEVRAGYECGIQITGFGSYEAGDVIESFEILKIKPTL